MDLPLPQVLIPKKPNTHCDFHLEVGFLGNPIGKCKTVGNPVCGKLHVTSLGELSISEPITGELGFER